MAVSLALLGYGASDSILTVFSALAQPRYWAAFAFAQSLATSIAYLLSSALPFDSYSIAWEARQVIYLALFPLGFLLGTLFPKGIAYLEERPPALIP